MYRQMLLHIFLHYKNSSKCEIRACLQISCNQGWETPFLSYDAPPFPQFFPIQIWCHRSQNIYSELCYTDTEGTVEIVHFNLGKN